MLFSLCGQVCDVFEWRVARAHPRPDDDVKMIFRPNYYLYMWGPLTLTLENGGVVMSY